jgi:integrase
MSGTITPIAIRAASRQAGASGVRAVLKDRRMPGLQLRITKHDVRAWSLVLRVGHRVRTLLLGYHPELGLAEARDAARRMLHAVRFEHRDPVRETRERRARERAGPGLTLDGLLQLYGAQVGKDVKSWSVQMEPAIRRIFKVNLVTPLAELTVQALQRTVDGYPSAKSASFGVRCLSTVLRWASASSRGHASPALLELRATAAKPVRSRVLSRGELASLLPALRSSDDVYAKAHELILLTAARRSEVAQARWRDVDLDAAVWFLPTTKNEQPFTVPLATQAVALLRSLRPADADGHDHVFQVNHRPLTSWEAATARIQAASATEGWTRHDLRRTSATLMGELGTPADVVELSLNHLPPGRRGLPYNFGMRTTEVRVALQKLADLFDGIATGGAEVRRLHLA